MLKRFFSVACLIYRHWAALPWSSAIRSGVILLVVYVGVLDGENGAVGRGVRDTSEDSFQYLKPRGMRINYAKRENDVILMLIYFMLKLKNYGERVLIVMNYVSNIQLDVYLSGKVL